MLNICEICWILNNKHTDHKDTESWPISRNCCVRFSQFRNTLCFQHWVINILKWPLWFYAATFAPADCSRAGPAVWMDLLQRHGCSFLSCCCPAWVTLWYHTSFLWCVCGTLSGLKWVVELSSLCGLVCGSVFAQKCLISFFRDKSAGLLLTSYNN